MIIIYLVISCMYMYMYCSRVLIYYLSIIIFSAGMAIMVVDTKVDLHAIPLTAPAGGSKDTTDTHPYHHPPMITPFTHLLRQFLTQETHSILKMSRHIHPIASNGHQDQDQGHQAHIHSNLDPLLLGIVMTPKTSNSGDIVICLLTTMAISKYIWDSRSMKMLKVCVIDPWLLLYGITVPSRK